jgi:hypothetical protein
MSAGARMKAKDYFVRAMFANPNPSFLHPDFG